LIQACPLTSYRTYRAPSGHGNALIEPSITTAGATLVSNQAKSASWAVTLQGRSIAALQKNARHELLRDAWLYSRRYRDVAEPAGDESIVMAGHQPTLFHPGVWFKNFALDQVARISSTPAHPVVAVNLVIDNDVASNSAVRIPVIDDATGLIRQESVPFDAAAGGVPYEQNRIRDRATFDSFDERLRDAIRPMVSNPCVTPLWQHAKAAVARCENVSCALAHARHGLEADVGLETLELPLSVICRTESFAAFTLAVISDAERFREIYNRSVKDYRLHHGIRSKAHPVPELASKDDWIETPFWLYGDDSPQRKPLWVRRNANMIELSDLKHKLQRVSSTDKPSSATELAALSNPNWKLRPRALMTTMYARMVLSDLFIHGIGGAKYDQLGDQIMQRFFGIEALEMMVVSATAQLPVDGLIDESQSVETIRRQLRSSRYSPEQFADQVDLPKSLLSRKRELLNAIPEVGQKLVWHRELALVNHSLAESLTDVRARLESQLQIAKQAATSATILKSREYSFCMFELEGLTETFAKMLGRK
jgi:hypothetical protein